MVEILKNISLSHSEISLRKDGIVEITFKEGTQIGLSECEELIASYAKILEPKKYPLLHIVENYVILTKEAREFSVTDNGLRFSIAEAYVIHSLAHKLVINFYLKVNKPAVPTKFFGKKEDAEEWLFQFM